jgi:outer membrane biosynthesis protein TonB
MDRAEVTGLGVATAGHAALLVALSLGLAATRLPAPKSDPIEVSFVDEVGLESSSPDPSAAPPAPMAGPPDLPPALAMPEPPAVEPLPSPPAPRREPQPQPKPPPRTLPPTPKTLPRPAPPRPAPAPPRQRTTRRDAGGLNNVVAGLNERESDSRSSDPPAAAASAEVKASLGRMVREQLRPHWQSPSGADAELLRTELSIWLERDGSVSRVEVIRTSGQTASNRPQVKLHQEQALRAVRLAAPFKLPDKFYDAWKYLSPIGFDRKLSR